MMNLIRLHRTRTLASALSSLLLGMAVLGAWTSDARACSTPVYRYAMYNWPPAPYRVFYFHHGQIPEQDAAVNKRLEEWTDAESPANVYLEVIDLSDETQTEHLPGVVEETRKEHADGQSPLYLVFSPYGTKIYGGPMGPKDIETLIDSPARKKIGALLQEGNVCAFVILTGEDKKQNEHAEKVMQEVIEAAAAGRVMTDLPVAGAAVPTDFMPAPVQEAPQDEPQDETPEDAHPETAEPAEDDPTTEEPTDSFAKLKVAVVKIARDDAAEKWLINQLMAVEEDLRDPEYAKETMIFAVYGRGRAMPPYLSKGINVDNLVNEISFLASSCSCMVKDQNPGMDLLMCWDWNAAAEAMAAEDESLIDDPRYGDPMGYREIELDEPGDETSDDPAPSDSRVDEVETPDAPPSDSEKASPKTTQSPARASASSDPLPKRTGSFATRQARTFTVLAIAATLLVVAIGFVVMLRGRPG